MDHLVVESMSWERPLLRDGLRDNAPSGRQRHTACILGTKLIVIGGFDGYKWLQDMHILDLGKLEEHALTLVAQNRVIQNLKHLLNSMFSCSGPNFRTDVVVS